MIIARKVRIYPTEQQETQLWKSAGVARFIYNWTISKQEENYLKGGKFISDNDLRKEITKLKQTEFVWLKEVSNNVAKQAVKDACDSYKRFFRGKSGKPKFKSRKKSKVSFYNDNVKIKVRINTVNIEKVGWVKIKPNSVPLCRKYSNPRISHDGKYWYISLGIEVENDNTELTTESIGIDVGIKELAVCSNGMVFKNINKTKEVKRLKMVLKRKQRRVSRKYEMNKSNSGKFNKTKNIAKMEKEIKLLHRKLANIRRNHTHQTTNKIVKTKPSRVVMETLNIKGMMKNRHLSKYIAEQCLYDFKLKMKYKCELNGIEFVEAGKWYPSSKTCSKCGVIKGDLKLKDRIYKCSCGLKIDRDLNASINLSRYELA